MKRFSSFAIAAVAGAALFVHLSSARPVTAQQPAAAPPAPGTVTVPEIPFDSNPNFLKYSPDMNLGEVLGVAINSKGQIMVLNHPGSATSGPVYGNASTQLFLFDQTGKFVQGSRQGRVRPRLRSQHPLRQVRQPLGRRQRHERRHEIQSRGLHGDESRTPAGRARRSGGVLLPRRPRQRAAVHVDNNFRQPTDVAWDSDDNIYITDGYTQLARRQVRQERQLGEVVGLARTRRTARQREPRPVQHAAQHRRSIARTTSTWPIATIAASRCSIATATSSGSFS